MNNIKKVGFGEYSSDFTKNGMVYDPTDDFLKISGYTREDIESGKISLYDFIPKEQQEEYKKIVSENLDQDVIYLKHPFVRKNGTVIYVLCLGHMVTPTIARVTITDYTEHMNLVAQYNSSQLELDSITSNVPGGVAVLQVEKDHTLTVCKCNDEFNKMFNLSAGDVYLSDKLEKNEAENLYKAIQRSIDKGKSSKYEISVKSPDGSVNWYRIYGNLYKYSYGLPLFYALAFDFTKEKKLNNKLLMETERFKIIAENSNEIYFDYDTESDVLTLTNCMGKYTEDDDNHITDFLSCNRADNIIYEEDCESFIKSFKEILKEPQSGNLEFRIKNIEEDGLDSTDYIWCKIPYVSVADEKNDVARVFGKIVSIQHLKSLKKKIHKDSEYINYLLETDNVTGLLNRKYFMKKAENILAECDENKVYAMVYSDINDFSYVNDNFGYEAGNKMLRDFGNLCTEVKGNLVSCRIYSDYFVGLYESESREAFVRTIEQRNNKFATMQKQKYPASELNISCGIFFITEADIDINTAIDNANLARRSIKESKSVMCGIYAQRMRTQRTHEKAIASELHSAIANRNIEMFLQPKFTIDTREIIGAEALARWKNSDGTYKMPYEFINILEKVGYIDELDFFIYEEALRTLEFWKKAGRTVIPISVNFSQHHVHQAGFVDQVIEMADNYDVDRSNIEIEITESCFSGDITSLFADMEKFRSNGFKVDIDDFGIGYSTLSVLMKAPVDIVKIDKSFIDNLEASKIDREYLQKMCSLIDLLKKDIIFEGVESEEQAKILSESGYNKAQGWLFDKAIPVSEFNRKYMGL